MRRRIVYWIIVESTYIFSVYSMLVVFFVLTFPRLRHIATPIFEGMAIMCLSNQCM